MELDLTRMTVSQAMGAVREALATYDSHEAIEIRTDSEVVKLNLYNQLHKMGMRCKLERKGSYFLLKAQPKGMSSERQASRKVNRAIERARREPEPDFEDEVEEQPIATPPSRPAQAARPKQPSNPNPYSVPQKESYAFPMSEDRVMQKPPAASKPRTAPQQAPKPEVSQSEASLAQAPPPADPAHAAPPAASYASMVQQQRHAATQQQPLRAEPPTPPTLFNGEFDERPLEPGQGPWLIFQHDQIGQKDNNLGVELLYQFLDSLVPGAYAGVFLVHRGVRLVDPQYQQAKLLRALLRKPIAVFADQTSMEYFKLIGRTSPRVKVVPFAALLELGRTEPVIWF